MATTRTHLLASNKHAWRYEMLLFIVGFMVAFGFAAWFVYGMIKDVFVSISLKKWLLKSRK